MRAFSFNPLGHQFCMKGLHLTPASKVGIHQLLLLAMTAANVIRAPTAGPTRNLHLNFSQRSMGSKKLSLV